MNKIFFTNHALERFEQRGLSFYSNNDDFVWYEGWSKNKLNRNKNVETLKKLFAKAEENSSFLNDTRFLVYLYERYGDNKYNFYILNNIVFLLINEEKIVTILPNNRLPLVENRKFVKRKRLSEQEKMYEQYKEHIQLISSYEKNKERFKVQVDERCFSNEVELQTLLVKLYGSSDYECIGKISGTRQLYSVADAYFIVAKSKVETIEEYSEKSPDFCLKSILKFFEDEKNVSFC